MPEQRRTHERDVAEQRHAERRSLVEFGLCEVDAHEGREARSKQAQSETCGVLIGVQPDHEQPKHTRQKGTGKRPRPKRQNVATRRCRGGKASDSGNQHHAFGAQVEHTRAFVDQQPEPRYRQRGPRINRCCKQKCKLVHHRAPS
jgi:hypothetical protein